MSAAPPPTPASRLAPLRAGRGRPRRRLDDVRRPQILSHAVALISERGLWDVRLVDVGRRAGVSAASVVYYFGTKDALLAEAIAAADEAFYRSLERELEGARSGALRIAALIVRSADADWPLWIDLWAYSRHHPETVPAQRRFHDRWRAALADAIRHGAAAGEWRVADPDRAALRLAALTDGLAVQMALGHPEHGRERYVEMSLAAAALELGVDVELLRGAAARLPKVAPAAGGAAGASPAGPGPAPATVTGSPEGGDSAAARATGGSEGGDSAAARAVGGPAAGAPGARRAGSLARGGH
ncbi:MAG TPA: TetR family transcriptional regulator C-terminal domain-containing protein [Solirubrobacteraceae bacterium]|nr:TetR family transcriptional regulator C-terminal domain-containing protein [Solirubrobacteraceae bacterium]